MITLLRTSNNNVEYNFEARKPFLFPVLDGEHFVIHI